MPAYTNDDVKELAALIMGESGGENRDAKVMVGSTVLNRLKSGRSKEFGGTIRDVIHRPNAYYAAQNKNGMYQQAMSQKFKSKQDENAWKESYAVASGLLKGTVKTVPGMFFHTDDEVVRNKRKGKAVFDYKKVKPVGKTSIWNVYTY